MLYYSQTFTRVPGSAAGINKTREYINSLASTSQSNNVNNMNGDGDLMFIPPIIDDPHTLGGLLKLWLREMKEPVIPVSM